MCDKLPSDVLIYMIQNFFTSFHDVLSLRQVSHSLYHTINTRFVEESIEEFYVRSRVFAPLRLQHQFEPPLTRTSVKTTESINETSSMSSPEIFLSYPLPALQYFFSNPIIFRSTNEFFRFFQLQSSGGSTATETNNDHPQMSAGSLYFLQQLIPSASVDKRCRCVDFSEAKELYTLVEQLLMKGTLSIHDAQDRSKQEEGEEKKKKEKEKGDDDDPTRIQYPTVERLILTGAPSSKVLAWFLSVCRNLVSLTTDGVFNPLVLSNLPSTLKKVSCWGEMPGKYILSILEKWAHQLEWLHVEADKCSTPKLVSAVQNVKASNPEFKMILNSRFGTEECYSYWHNSTDKMCLGIAEMGPHVGALIYPETRVRFNFIKMLHCCPNVQYAHVLLEQPQQNEEEEKNVSPIPEAQSFSKLKTLILEHDSQHEDAAQKVLFNEEYAQFFSTCPELTTFRVSCAHLKKSVKQSSTTLVDEKSNGGAAVIMLESLVAHCKNIFTLQLEHLPGLTDQHVQSLIIPALGSNLIALSLDGCSISDLSVKAFVESCPVKLQRLNLSNTKITQASIHCIASTSNFVRQLKEFELVGIVEDEDFNISEILKICKLHKLVTSTAYIGGDKELREFVQRHGETLSELALLVATKTTKAGGKSCWFSPNEHLPYLLTGLTSLSYFDVMRSLKGGECGGTAGGSQTKLSGKILDEIVYVLLPKISTLRRLCIHVSMLHAKPSCLDDQLLVELNNKYAPRTKEGGRIKFVLGDLFDEVKFVWSHLIYRYWDFSEL